MKVSDITSRNSKKKKNKKKKKNNNNRGPFLYQNACQQQISYGPAGEHS
jgi:hypothetical protein